LVEINAFKKDDVHVTVYLYNDTGMGIDELGKVNRKIKEILEASESFKDGCYLEISSPGIFRKINYIEEFDIFLDKDLKIVKNDDVIVIGKNKGIVNKDLIIDENGNKLVIPLENIKKASLNG